MKKMRQLLKTVYRGIQNVALTPVFLYRKFISPHKGAPSCRFTPTCSQYAIEAVREWGIICGTALAICRIIRCNPFSKGGEDPVPKRPRRKSN